MSTGRQGLKGTRFSNDTFFKIILLLGMCMALDSSNKLPGEKEAGVHLAYFCVTPALYNPRKLPVIMMHGLSDVKETWNGTYEQVSFLTQRRVCLYDARNHGDSGWSDTWSVDILAEDLGRFMRSLNIPKAALVGHSLGGLTAMRFALKHPNKVEKMFMEDIGPVSVSNDTGDVKAYVRGMMNSVRAVPEGVDEDTAKKMIADYLIKNLNMTADKEFFDFYHLILRDGRWQWKSNFQAFMDALDNERPFLGTMRGRYNGPAFFIYGTASPFKVGAQRKVILKLFPKAHLFAVEGANHDMHGDYPIYLRKLVRFLKRGVCQ